MAEVVAAGEFEVRFEIGGILASVGTRKGEAERWHVSDGPAPADVRRAATDAVAALGGVPPAAALAREINRRLAAPLVHAVETAPRDAVLSREGSPVARRAAGILGWSAAFGLPAPVYLATTGALAALPRTASAADVAAEINRRLLAPAHWLDPIIAAQRAAQGEAAAALVDSVARGVEGMDSYELDELERVAARGPR